jgi:hypothetical protein
MFVSEGDGYGEITCRRVYHINIIIHSSTKYKCAYQRFRIVFNRNGIAVIEEI